MLLTPSKVDLFFRLHRCFMYFVNERLQIVPGIETPDEFSGLSPETRLSVRKAFLESTDLIESFVAANPFEFVAKRYDSGAWSSVAVADQEDTDLQVTGVTGFGDFAIGELFVQADYANTLELLAREGPDVFYQGEIADAISADFEANGGFVTKEDLAGDPMALAELQNRTQWRSLEGDAGAPLWTDDFSSYYEILDFDSDF